MLALALLLAGAGYIGLTKVTHATLHEDRVP